MPPTFTTLSSVGNGTTLSASLYNNNIGKDGSLKWLYYAMNPYYGDCADQSPQLPLDVRWFYTAGTLSVTGGTWTTIPWDTFDFGQAFYDSTNTVFSPANAGCTSNVDANTNLMITMNAIWAGALIGHIGLRIVMISNNNCTPIVNLTSNTQQKVFFNQVATTLAQTYTFMLPMVVTSNLSDYTFRTQVFTHVTRTLSTASIRVFKLPIN